MKKPPEIKIQDSFGHSSIQQLEDYNPVFISKRRLLILSFFLRNLFSGIQYSIILSSAWKYLSALGESKWYYGLVIGMYPISTLLVSPFVDHIYRRTRRTKEIFRFLTVMQVVGSLLFTLPYSPWLPFVGRCLSGIGESGTSVAFKEIKSLTWGDGKVKACSLVMSGFMAGILCGPLLNLLFCRISFYVGTWQINYRNAPGLFCAMMWLMMMVILQLMLSNVAYEYIGESERDSKRTDLLSEGQQKDEDHEDDVFYDNDLSSEKLLDSNKGTLMEYLENLAFYEIAAIYFSSIVSWLILFQNETLIPLVTQNDFRWSILDTSIVYVVAGLYTTGFYVIFGLQGKRMSDITSIIFVQCFSMLVSALWIVYESFKDNYIISRVLFILTLSLGYTYESLNSVATSSLLTKATPSHMSEVALQYRLKTTMIGNAIGPIWGSLLYGSFNLYSGVNILLSLTALIWLCLSIERLRYRLFLFNGEISPD